MCGTTTFVHQDVDGPRASQAGERRPGPAAIGNVPRCLRPAGAADALGQDVHRGALPRRAVIELRRGMVFPGVGDEFASVLSPAGGSSRTANAAASHRLARSAGDRAPDRSRPCARVGRPPNTARRGHHPHRVAVRAAARATMPGRDGFSGRAPPLVFHQPRVGRLFWPKPSASHRPPRHRRRRRRKRTINGWGPVVECLPAPARVFTDTAIATANREVGPANIAKPDRRSSSLVLRLLTNRPGLSSTPSKPCRYFAFQLGPAPLAIHSAPSTIRTLGTIMLSDARPPRKRRRIILLTAEQELQSGRPACPEDVGRTSRSRISYCNSRPRSPPEDRGPAPS